jgi:hypothetical protein
VRVDLALPDHAHVTVIDATGRPSLAATAVLELRLRGLDVTVGAATTESYAGVVEVRYGPQAVGAAWLAALMFGVAMPGTSVVWSDQFQPTRTGTEVDLVLGRRFDHLATVTEVNNSIATHGLRMAPPGTCSVR